LKCFSSYQVNTSVVIQYLVSRDTDLTKSPCGGWLLIDVLSFEIAFSDQSCPSIRAYPLAELGGFPQSPFTIFGQSFFVTLILDLLLQSQFYFFRWMW